MLQKELTTRERIIMLQEEQACRRNRDHGIVLL